MAFIFDHLIAILVGATLIGALLFIQQRGQQTAIETVTRHRAETQTSSFLSTLSRDIENARTSRQIDSALGTWTADEISDHPSRAFGLHGDATHTEWIEFVTLANPDSGNDSDVMAVGYRAVELPDSATVGGTRLPLHRVDRYVFERGASDWVQQGGSASNLTQFALEAMTLDGSSFVNGRRTDVPAAVTIELGAAELTLDRKASDQRATTRSNATQQAITVRVINATSTGAASTPLADADKVVIPLFEGIDPPAPAAPGSGGSTGGGSGGGSTGGGSGSGGGGSTGTTTTFPGGGAGGD